MLSFMSVVVFSQSEPVYHQIQGLDQINIRVSVTARLTDTRFLGADVSTDIGEQENSIIKNICR